MTAKELLENDWPMSLARNPDGEGFDGCCPCGTITGDNFAVEFHCWRARCDHGCDVSGIHVSGTLDTATKRKIAEHIRDNNGWTNHTDWNIVIL